MRRTVERAVAHERHGALSPRRDAAGNLRPRLRARDDDCGKAREAIDELEEVGDPESMDIITEVSRGVDKWLWFVEAHAQTRPVAAEASRSQR